MFPAKNFVLAGYWHCYIALNYYEEVYLLGVPADCHGVMGKNANEELFPGITVKPLMFFKTFLLWFEAFFFLDLISISLNLKQRNESINPQLSVMRF